MFNILMLIAGLVLAFWFIGNALGLLLMLFVAALIGIAAESLIPGPRVTHGWLGAMGAGLIGSWLGTTLIGQVGPVLMGVPLVPAMVGAVLLCATISMITRSL